MEQLTEHDQHYFNNLPIKDLLNILKISPFNFIINNGKIDSIEWVDNKYRKEGKLL